jgi:guanylate kinase
MQKAIDNNEFIEYANVHTNYYGTSVAAVEKVASLGKVCILDIDIQGVRSVKKSTLACKYLFIAPPSEADLEMRLRGRNTETEEKIQIRLKTAVEELAFGRTEGNFDALVVNDDLHKCLMQIETTLKNWFPDMPYEQPTPNSATA